MIEYKLRKIRQQKYGDYRDDILDLIDENPGQMSFEEYAYIYNLINLKNGCNVLVFGTGKDSELWSKANKNGKTIFLEDDLQWINHASVMGIGLDIRHVEYTDLGYDAERLLEEYESGKNNLKLNLDEDVRNTNWDIIVVDGPACYGFDKPCRMKSIYESYNLSDSNTDVVIHDVGKKIVKMYSEYFFKDKDLVTLLGECSCNSHPLCRCNVLKHFKKGINDG